MSDEPTERDVEALRAAALADLDVCPFAEDVNDASVCRLCRLPAIGHDEIAVRIALGNHPGVAALLDALNTAAERIAEARREGAADELDKQAYAITPGDHHCFKPWCPQCQARKVREQARDALHARANALRGDG